MSTTTTKPKRQISEAIQKLRDEHKTKVDALNKTQASAAILKNIIEVKLPKLTPTDTAALRSHLSQPPLPIIPA